GSPASPGWPGSPARRSPGPACRGFAARFPSFCPPVTFPPSAVSVRVTRQGRPGGQPAAMEGTRKIMRVLVVGATGAIGRPLVPMLAAQGHQVTGTSRSAARAGLLRSLGAAPAALDVLDPAAVRAVVAAAR